MQYRYAVGGTLTIVGCNSGKEIEWEVPGGGCVFSVGEQALTGVSYNNIGEEAKGTAEITTQMKLSASVVTASAGCASLIEATSLIGRYTTGNFLLTAETSGGAMVNFWWN